MAFKVSPFHKQANGSPFQIKSPLNVSYDAAYEAQSDEKKASQSKGEFKKAAEKYNMDNYGTKTPSKGIDDDFKSKAKTEKLKSETEEYKKKREVTAKAKADAETKKEESKTKVEPKTKTGKQKRAEKRVGRLKKKQDKGKTLSASQEKKLSRNRSKAAGEKVKDEDKTKVGKTIKKGVDKVKDVVSKDSPAEMNMDSKRKKIERKTKKIDRISSRAAKAGGKGNEKRATRLSAKAVGKTAERNFLVEDYNSKIDNPKNSKYVSNK
jgi:hypothetical protein